MKLNEENGKTRRRPKGRMTDRYVDGYEIEEK